MARLSSTRRDIRRDSIRKGRWGADATTSFPSSIQAGITAQVKDHLAMLSTAEFDRLMRPDRRAVAIEAMTDEEIEQIATAEIRVECFALDAELDGWTP